MAISYNAARTQRYAQGVPCFELDVSEMVTHTKSSESNRSAIAVYPVGYSLGESLLYVEQLMADPMMLLIDTRLSPKSWRSDWTREALEAKWGNRYHWAGRYLGNKNVFNGGPIEIANPGKGIAGLQRCLNEGHSLILLCQCADFSSCHRSVICGLLSQAMPEVDIVSQPQVVSTKPVQSDALTLFAIEMPAEQEAVPEVGESQPVAVEEPQLCWKCKFPPRWVVDPMDGTNVCACVVEGRKEIERMQPKWDAARKRARK